jgi:hypothetical protein
MGIVIRALDAAFVTSDRNALAVLIPTGIATYLLMCWLLDVAHARSRAARYFNVARSALAQFGKRWMRS